MLPLGERGVAVYSFETKRLERVAENIDSGDTIPSWLADSRRVVFESKNKIFITASEKKVLSRVPENIGSSFISSDNRLLY